MLDAEAEEFAKAMHTIFLAKDRRAEIKAVSTRLNVPAHEINSAADAYIRFRTRLQVVRGASVRYWMGPEGKFVPVMVDEAL